MKTKIIFIILAIILPIIVTAQVVDSDSLVIGRFDKYRDPDKKLIIPIPNYISLDCGMDLVFLYLTNREDMFYGYEHQSTFLPDQFVTKTNLGWKIQSEKTIFKLDMGWVEASVVMYR